MSDGRQGSVRFDENRGTWYFVVDTAPVGAPRKQVKRRRGADGKPFETRRAAQKALTELLGSLATQTYVEPSKLTLKAYLEQRWLPAVESDLRPSTYASYAKNVRLHLAGRPIGDVPLQKLDAAMIEQHYGLLLRGSGERKPLSARTTHYVGTILSRALRDAVRWRLLMFNAAHEAKSPSQKNGPSRPMATWSAAELRRFLTATADDDLSAAWWLIAHTGLRRGEALGLRWADVDLEHGVLSVNRTLVTVGPRRADDPGIAWSDPKTRKGRRRVVIDDQLAAVLRSHRARLAQTRLLVGSGYADGDLVLAGPAGEPIHPDTMSWHFEKAVRKHKMPKISLHGLRHTRATLALKAGVHPRVVQEMLGHANVSITLNTYSHVDLDDQVEAARRIAALEGTL